MKTFIYPGTFDPFTNGHTDIARRAVVICDKLYVAILTNNTKKTYFTVEERINMARISLKGIPNIEIESFDGLLVDYFKMRGACAVVRGLRSESDFRYEAELTAANKLLLPKFEAVLLPCRMDLAFTSSTIVREVASYGGDVSGMVSKGIVQLIADKLKR
ncbi:MAG: pantetheine-phosphate adenylyltransferase [Saccharofermentanales bacterium]